MKRRKRKKLLIFFGVAFSLCLAAYFYIEKNINPIIYSASETKIQALSQIAVHNAVASVIKENISYTDLTDITYDKNGKIILIQTDSVKINLLALETLDKVMNNLQIVGTQGIGIPLGTMSGIPIFSGHGPNVTIKVKPISTSEYSYFSEFREAGINQTNHKVYFEIINYVKAILPGRDREFITNITVLIAENIIIGDVPSVYLNAGKIEGALNLVP